MKKGFAKVILMLSIAILLYSAPGQIFATEIVSVDVLDGNGDPKEVFKPGDKIIYNIQFLEAIAINNIRVTHRYSAGKDPMTLENLKRQVSRSYLKYELTNLLPERKVHQFISPHGPIGPVKVTIQVMGPQINSFFDVFFDIT